MLRYTTLSHKIPAITPLRRGDIYGAAASQTAGKSPTGCILTAGANQYCHRRHVRGPTGPSGCYPQLRSADGHPTALFLSPALTLSSHRLNAGLSVRLPCVRLYYLYLILTS